MQKQEKKKEKKCNKKLILVAKKAKEEAVKAREEAREQAQKTKEETLQFKTRLTIMHGWHRDAPLDLIADMADASLNQVRQLIAVFQKVKNECQSNPEYNLKTLVQLSGLNETEVKTLLNLLGGQK
jgi:hypothetical protein